MVLILALMIGPGAVAMIVSWTAADSVLRTTARREAFRTAGDLARLIGEQIQREGIALNALAKNPEVAAAARAFIEMRLDGAREIPAPPQGFATVYLIDSTGNVAAEFDSEGDLRRPDSPPMYPGLEEFAVALALREQEGLVLGESPAPPAGQAHLFMGLSLEDSGGASLLGVATLEPIFREAEDIDRQVGQRLIVVSRRAGLLHTTRQDSDLEAAIETVRPRLFYTENPEEFERATIRSLPYALAYAPVRPLLTLSANEAGVAPVEWVAVHLVDLNQLLAPVDRIQWVLIMAGLSMVLVALGLSVVVSGWLVRPIRTLRAGLEEFTAGNLDHRVDVRTNDELQALASAANTMAQSLRRANETNHARLLELDQKARQLELIHGISHSVNRFLDLDLLFERITNELRAQIPCDRMSLALLNADRTRLVLEYVYPQERTSLPRGTEILPERSLLWRAMDEGVVLLQGLGKSDDFEDVQLSRLGMNILAIVPLTATSGVIGTFNLAAKDATAIGDGDVRLLGQVAESVALAVEHGRLYGEAARFAERLEEMVEQRTAQLRRAQAKLSAAERFAATGSMAAHIAHEVNNPLSIIKNYLRIVSGRIERATDPGDGSRDSAIDGLRVIDEEIDRIARIVSQLRQIANPSSPKVEEADVAAEIQGLVELFEGSTRRRKIEVEIDIEPNVGTVLVCRDHLRQVLINLARNAIDAMAGDGGILTFRAGPDPVAPDLRYRIEVADTGPGIPPETLRRIFDPFFTTKGEAQGSGLGLSVSQSLAHGMGGSLEAFSALGEGTIFRLTLPRKPSGDGGDGDDDGAARAEPYIKREGGRIIVG